MVKTVRTIITLVLFLGTVLPAQENRNLETLPQPPDSVDRRTALVIGNSAYDNSPLENPVHDAGDIAQILTGLGFEVELLLNGSEEEMKRSINRFGDKLQEGGVGLFYFAGHGIQMAGRNFLVPVNARIEIEQDVEFETVDVGRVLGQMENARNHTNILILDACRNNPYTRSFRSVNRGLAKIAAPKGTFIAYATAPGQVAADGRGSNSPYTEALLQEMRIPGLKIEDVFKRVRKTVAEQTTDRQIPWDSSSLTEDFYFLGRGEEVPPAVIPPDRAPGKGSTLTDMKNWAGRNYLWLVIGAGVLVVGGMIGLYVLRLIRLKRQTTATEKRQKRPPADPEDR